MVNSMYIKTLRLAVDTKLERNQYFRFDCYDENNNRIDVRDNYTFIAHGISGNVVQNNEIKYGQRRDTSCAFLATNEVSDMSYYPYLNKEIYGCHIEYNFNIDNIVRVELFLNGIGDTVQSSSLIMTAIYDDNSSVVVEDKVIGNGSVFVEFLEINKPDVINSDVPEDIVNADIKDIKKAVLDLNIEADNIINTIKNNVDNPAINIANLNYNFDGTSLELGKLFTHVDKINENVLNYMSSAVEDMIPKFKINDEVEVCNHIGTHIIINSVLVRSLENEKNYVYLVKDINNKEIIVSEDMLSLKI